MNWFLLKFNSKLREETEVELNEKLIIVFDRAIAKKKLAAQHDNILKMTRSCY